MELPDTSYIDLIFGETAPAVSDLPGGESFHKVWRVEPSRGKEYSIGELLIGLEQIRGRWTYRLFSLRRRLPDQQLTCQPDTDDLPATIPQRVVELVLDRAGKPRMVFWKRYADLDEASVILGFEPGQEFDAAQIVAVWIQPETGWHIMELHDADAPSFRALVDRAGLEHHCFDVVVDWLRARYFE